MVPFAIREQIRSRTGKTDGRLSLGSGNQPKLKGGDNERQTVRKRTDREGVTAPSLCKRGELQTIQVTYDL